MVEYKGTENRTLKGLDVYNYFIFKNVIRINWFNSCTCIPSKNLRFSVGRNNNCNNNNPNGTCSPKPAQNMIIETPSNCINLIPSPPLNSSFQVPQHAAPERHSNNNNGSQSFPIGNLTPQAEAALSLNSIGMQTPNVTAGSSNESLKSLLGFQGNVSGEMMPVFASRLMDFIQSGLQNPSVHKPVYDMKIQKDIHEIQVICINYVYI